ncbi:MAG: hypothetical protein JWL64_1140 [Frankiales bacterium]|nr:hypothetical protein [Frankiales bacterium]
MPESPYAIRLEELERSVHVPVDRQVETQDSETEPEPPPDLWPQLRWPN